MKTPLAFICASLIVVVAHAAKAPTPAQTIAPITLRDFKLVGDLNSERAAFVLNTIVKVENPKGGTLDLLSGSLALTELGAHPRWKIRAEENRYALVFDRSGEFPV